MPATEHLDQNASSLRLAREKIPNIDLGPLFAEQSTQRDKTIEQVRQACHDPGFFYVRNTCVKEDTIEAALTSARLFFDTNDNEPLKQKVHNRNGGGMKGWGPMFGEPAYQKGTIAHVESFDIGQQLNEKTCHDLSIEPNIWPDLPDFRQAVLDYYDEVTRLGRVISGLFSEILGEQREFINDRSGPGAPRTLRMLHYPASQSQDCPQHVGIAAHTDFECFTIMHQTAAGLELTHANGEWCEAPADVGSFTIILGDMLERFSNGHLKATGHRVVNTPWTRYSMVLFFAVDGEYAVKPLPQFVSSGMPSRYETVTQAEHIDRELQRANANSVADPAPDSNRVFSARQGNFPNDE